MIRPGTYNTLTILRSIEHGLILCDEEENEVLLPQSYVDNSMKVGSDIEVFIYLDSEDRIIATTETPKIKLHEFALLRVVDVNRFGAFLDWGLKKDLLVPFREQNVDMEEGRSYVVFLYIDDQTNRLVASAKIRNILDNDEIDLVPNQEVDILVYAKTDLGYKVIINHLYDGLMYHNEVFREFHVGEVSRAYVKRIREDNKIDISIQQQGYSAISSLTERILAVLAEGDGFLDLTDKSVPDEIQERLQMSKKSFKKAIGYLYKNKQIRMESEGIFLLDKPSVDEEE